METEETQCKVCGKDVISTQLGLHVYYSHGMTSQPYYDKFIRKEGEGMCQNPGCLEMARFASIISGYGKYCSHACWESSPITAQQTSQQFKGKKISGEVVARRVKSWVSTVKRTPEWNKRIGDSNRGQHRCDCTRANMRRARQLQRGKPRKPISAQGRLNMSLARIRSMLLGRGVNNWSRGIRGEYFSLKQNQYIQFDSLLESQALFLMDHFSTVQQFQRCPFPIAYEWADGSHHQYHPDFYFKESGKPDTVVEVKPQAMFEENHNQEKFTAARAFCAAHGFRFVIWSDVTLGHFSTAGAFGRKLTQHSKEEKQNACNTTGHV